MAAELAYKEFTVNTNGILDSKEKKFLQNAIFLTIMRIKLTKWHLA